MQRMRAIRRLLLRLVALLLVLAIVVLGGVGWVGSERAIHPSAVTYPWRLGDYSTLHPLAVTFISRTHTRIAGRFFPGRSHATIVLSHGYGDNQNQMLPWAAFLNQAGFSVFTYDMRDRGLSGGSAVTLGALEQQDLISAVAYLLTRRDVDPRRLGALGVSLGGATTILAAAQDQRIRAVVDDCGFADARSVIDSSFEHFVHLPAFPFSPVAIAIAELRDSINVDAIRPVDRVAQISPRPIFIIHGTADRTIPPLDSMRLFAAAGAPKQIWWVPGATHWHSLQVAHAQYVRRVVAFFRRYLHV